MATVAAASGCCVHRGSHLQWTARSRVQSTAVDQQRPLALQQILIGKQMETILGNRALSLDEMTLARWMLEHGTPEAMAFLPQLESAEVTPWRCQCGCASMNFQIRGRPEAPPGVHILGDFVVGEGDGLSGAFIFESGGTLSGLEVCGLAGDAPYSLPSVKELRQL